MPDGTKRFTVHLNAPSDEVECVPLLEGAVREALGHAPASEGEVSVTLLPDEPMAALNRRYLKRDYVPDVLAFPLHAPGEAILGDVYVGLDQARRQAAEAGVSLTEELIRLAVHGALHLAGFEHPEGGEAGRAASEHFQVQERIVARVLGRADSGADAPGADVSGPAGEEGV